MTKQAINIADLAQWSDPQEVKTRNGLRLLSKAAPDDKFWDLYRGNKAALKAVGVSVSKDRKTGQWEACWWQQPSVEAQAAKIEQIERSLQSASDAKLRELPNGLEYLPFQKAGIAYAMTAKNTLIGDEMGLGKTIQAIGVINESRAKSVIIIPPAFLKINWARELEKWLIDPLSIGIADSKNFPKTDVVIINYDILKAYGKFEKQGRSEVFIGPELSRHWDLRIIDEAHYCKNAKAKRTRATFAIEADRKIALTGTPIPNRPIEAQPILNDLAPGDWEFFPYAKRYCAAHRNSWGWDFSGSSNLDELQERLRSSLMVRRLKADVLKDLPPKVRQVVPLEGSEVAVLKEFGIDPKASWAEVVAEFSSSTAGFEVLSKLRHQIALSKVPTALEFIQDALEEGPLLVFAHHKDVVALLAEGLEGCVTATGDHSKEADEAVQSFQRGDTDCFIGTIGACGVGLTLTRASRVIFVELDWVPGNVSQAEDRAHRIGQEDTVLVQHLVVDGGLDAYIAQTIVNKQAVIDAALDRALDLKIAEVDETVVIDPDAIERTPQLPQLPDEQVAAIHSGLQSLASMCDGARELDGMGFNAFDSHFGKKLAAAFKLTNKQAHLGMKLVNKYRGQLPADLVATAKGVA